MSEILWCDPGGHQFSANDPQHKTWTEQQTYEDASRGKRPLRFDACGEHKGYDGMGTDAVKASAIAIQEAVKNATKATKAVTAAPKGKRLVDQEEYDKYIAFLESNEAP